MTRPVASTADKFNFRLAHSTTSPLPCYTPAIGRQGSKTGYTCATGILQYTSAKPGEPIVFYSSKELNILCLSAMSMDYRLCELATVSLHVNDLETDPGLDDHPKHEDRIRSEGEELFLNTNVTVNGESSTKPVRNYVETPVGSGADSVSASGEAKLCPEHECELQLYCNTEGRLKCSQCVLDGACQGHTVTELVTRATVVRVSH